MEARSPFLDCGNGLSGRRVCPSNLKVRRMAGKWLLKPVFGEMLPPAISARGKQGFRRACGAVAKVGLTRSACISVCGTTLR